jgi:hypothetical protein
MTISMFDASVPVLLRGLRNLHGVVGKGHAHATARSLDPAVLMSARLYPDMFPFARQIQICADMAKGVARLAGIEVPRHEDTETTFPELQARLDATIEFIGTLSYAAFEESDSRTITLALRSGTLELEGRTYLFDFLLPSFFFHSATAYGLLRHNGVELGKRDFLGPMPGR